MGASERNCRQTDVLILTGSIDQDAVPVNLQVGRDPNALRARGQLPCQVGGHSSRPTGRKAHVVDDANPFSLGVERVDIRRDGLDPGLRRSVHAVRGVIFDLSVKQQPERPTGVRFAEIEFERVRLGKTRKLSQAKITEVAVGQQIREHVVAVLILRRGGRARGPADYHFEWRVRRIAGEVLVGINVKIGGMIDGHELYLVKIDRFFQRLHEPETELAVFLSNRIAVNFDVFRRPGNIALPGPYPVSDDARAEHVPDQLIALSIPNEKGGARTSTAIDFHKFLFAIARDFHFVLQNSSRPEHADNISLGSLAKADGEVGRILSEIAGRSRDLELLPIPSGKHFDFGSDRAFVVVQSFESEAQPMVLIASFISKQDRWP